MTDTATIVDAAAQTRDAASTSAGRDVTIPLNQLFHSPANVRKQRSDQGIAELAALIKSQGLLQRLSVTAVGDGRFAVEAGGRRLAACLSLAAEGYFADDQGIDCRLYESERAVAISMAENSGRLDAHDLGCLSGADALLSLAGHRPDAVWAAKGVDTRPTKMLREARPSRRRLNSRRRTKAARSRTTMARSASACAAIRFR